jgi:hypothetical protein
MNLSENDIERSLLQKAVRRGNEAVVEKVIKYLFSVDDTAWLKKRLFVMIYEECWTLGNELTATNLTEDYKKITRSVKNKNAAGLASLAWHCKNGDLDIFQGMTSEYIDNVQSVAYGIESPDKYWKFIENESGYQKNRYRIESAQLATPKASFDYDKALMYAAACLSVEEEIPETIVSVSCEEDFPYWIALDKHTEKGRSLITDASKKIGLDPYTGMQLAFIMEGALCNEMVDAPYWNHYVNWRIKKMGPAVARWDELKEVIINHSKKNVDSLLERICEEEETPQLSLF